LTSDEYERTKNQILLAASVIQIISLEELVAFVEFVEKAEAIGIGDRQKWVEVRGNTDLLSFVARRLIDIKTVLPDPKKEG
jgi:hypothetical protein